MKTVSRISKLGISAGYWIGASAWRLINRALGRRLPATSVALYYHTISKEEAPRFVAQMDLLKKLARPIRLDGLEDLNEGNHYAAVTFDDGFQSFFQNILPLLLGHQIPTTLFVAAGYLGSHPDWADEPWDPNPDEPVMTETQVRELPAEWVTVGSHTMTHPDLTLLADDEIRRELVDSKERLESLTGRPVTLLSVPYGFYDERVVRLAAEAGYEKVFVGLVKPAIKGGSVLGRVRANPSDSKIEFRLKLLGCYDWVSTASYHKQRILNVLLRQEGVRGRRGALQNSTMTRAQPSLCTKRDRGDCF